MNEIDLPHYNEPKMCQGMVDFLTVMAGLALILIALFVTGCAGWSDYAAEVRTVNAQIAADKKAQADRDAKDEAGYLAAMASAQTDTARVAMAGFWAVAKAKGGSVAQGPGYIAVQPPPDHVETVARVVIGALPVVGTVAVAKYSRDVAMQQSDNAAKVSISTNESMVQLGQQGAGVATALVNQMPNLKPNMTFTIGRDGTIGSGPFSPTTQNLTTGGDGVIGSGSVTKPANPTRVCTINPTTGEVTCS